MVFLVLYRIVNASIFLQKKYIWNMYYNGFEGWTTYFSFETVSLVYEIF